MNHTSSERTADVIKNNVAPDEGVIQACVPYLLQGPNAYSNVSYIARQQRHGNCTYCELCEMLLFQGDLNGQESLLKAHVRSDRHQCRYFQLTLAQKNYLTMLRHKRLDATNSLRKEAHKLRLNRWKEKVSHLLIQYIDAPLPVNKNDKPTPEDRCWEALEEQLDQYYKTECLCLLELALWKSRRCFCPDCTENRDEESKQIRRVKCGATVIVPLVKEFLFL